MSIHVALNHVTRYRYDRSVSLSPQIVRLRPAPHCRTRILAYSLRIEPARHFINWQQDPHANYLARLAFPEKTRELSITVDLVAELAVHNPFDFFLEPYAQAYPFAYEAAERHDLEPYLAKLPLTERLSEYLAATPRQNPSVVQFLVDLNRRVARDVRYVIRLEPGVQSPEQTLDLASGSCRDSSWLLVQLLRQLGLAARFVSGYLVQLATDVTSIDGPSGPAQDFTDLHAWCEVYLPGAGWIGLDPTSGLLAGEGHLPLACTPDPASAAPVSGLVEPAQVSFEHLMGVQRIWEAPRVTKPYTEEQWRDIEIAGLAVDRDLDELDVRLTLGGEPTFVSIDDPEGEEWNTAALGEHKRQLAAKLFRRLKEHYGPLGLAHFGQGKWYPGEALPRWSLNCFWRRDGEPLWSDPELLADESLDYGASADTARRFLGELTGRLGVSAEHLMPAYEDAFYYLWRERRLPMNVDPLESRLSDPVERARLARTFEHGLERPVGFVLPLARDAAERRWRSGPWFLRDERCYLIPGDSPLGYRLPLDSLPWVRPGEYPHVHVPDPTQVFPPLATRAQLQAQLRMPSGEPSGQPERWADRSGGPRGWIAERSEEHESRAPQPQESAPWVTRTALCAEARAGVLYVFMPPLARLEDYVQLLAAVEEVAAALRQPLIVEGYEPPADSRLQHFRVTPDPGVIEVNIHPASGWEELIERTSFLYEAARQSRLRTEKFMHDGRHVGTGGGNHFVLGGATPSDSPFLRRPDLLASLLGYWHNHPSLSYLFSGLFIGPTSQAPRTDEARNDSLYELEIAFEQLPAPDSSLPAWLTDRLFRNLLIDVTGNTHRAEFCIDKLYAPEGAAGRQGLLELRAFEMPPHARMSLTQQLLLRSLVARFWREPYRPGRLARWGTELHDRFMLPHFVAEDFADVIAEQNAAGYALQLQWFAPHLEFRFPKLGDFAERGALIELRQALEPWHVMGEQGGGSGTVRYVDSSLERLQVKVTGLAPDRYCIACNGRRVPLTPTGRAGEFIAGVRYRAWQPPTALHPRIGVHSPLTFDLVDTWMQRSLGGCQYHVMHPGGRNYVTFPVNAFESESRRLARFFRMGHTPGTVAAPPESVNPDFPFTLDLRRG
ncbi:MAG TPA: transglutaminase family protein [Steroidobacteraceae bacterium]|nr:transglutaminase family protein [Steroidobacteraceae bacterium]